MAILRRQRFCKTCGKQRLFEKITPEHPGCAAIVFTLGLALVAHGLNNIASSFSSYHCTQCGQRRYWWIAHFLTSGGSGCGAQWVNESPKFNPLLHIAHIQTLLSAEYTSTPSPSPGGSPIGLQSSATGFSGVPSDIADLL